MIGVDLRGSRGDRLLISDLIAVWIEARDELRQLVPGSPEYEVCEDVCVATLAALGDLGVHVHVS